MEKWSSTEEVLDFAIAQEERAKTFYLNLAQTTNEGMRAVFEGFAQEEEGHKKLLIKLKEGKRVVAPVENVANLKIADYVVAMQPRPDMTYEEALVVAMHREKAAFKLYTRLASMVEDPKVKSLLLAIAQEEAKHKLRFEVEYDDLCEEPRHNEETFSGSPPNQADADVNRRA